MNDLQIVKDNKLEDSITLIHGKLEDIELPVPKVPSAPGPCTALELEALATSVLDTTDRGRQRASPSNQLKYSLFVSQKLGRGGGGRGLEGSMGVFTATRHGVCNGAHEISGICLF